MARIKIQLPERSAGTYTIPVRITDLNYGNHVGNDSFVTLLHEARVQWLASGGFSELDAGGTSLIMGDLAVEFKSEVHYGDTLNITVFVGEVTTVSFELFYEFKNQHEAVVARAKTGLVCFDYTAKKVTAVSATLKEFLSRRSS